MHSGLTIVFSFISELLTRVASGNANRMSIVVLKTCKVLMCVKLKIGIDIFGAVFTYINVALKTMV